MNHLQEGELLKGLMANLCPVHVPPTKVPYVNAAGLWRYYLEGAWTSPYVPFYSCIQYGSVTHVRLAWLGRRVCAGRASRWLVCALLLAASLPMPRSGLVQPLAGTAVLV